MRKLVVLPLLILFLLMPSFAQSSVQLCNRADATILVAIGLEQEGVISTKGWWKIYPGLCGEPVSTDKHEGSYFIHARAHPLLTDVADGFVWGEQKAICVIEDDFDVDDVSKCPENSFLAGFNEYQGSWKNTNIINILNPEKNFSEGGEVRIAGVQKMLILLGYPINTVSGKMDNITNSVLQELAKKHQIDTSSFQALFVKLDELIIKDIRRQK